MRRLSFIQFEMLILFVMLFCNYIDGWMNKNTKCCWTKSKRRTSSTIKEDECLLTSVTHTIRHTAVAFLRSLTLNGKNEANWGRTIKPDTLLLTWFDPSLAQIDFFGWMYHEPYWSKSNDSELCHHYSCKLIL